MFCTIVFVNGHSELHYILRLVRQQRSLKLNYVSCQNCPFPFMDITVQSASSDEWKALVIS